jgi:hypothetical protein
MSLTSLTAAEIENSLYSAIQLSISGVESPL